MKTLLVILFLIMAVVATCFVFFVYWMNRVITDSKETQYGPFKIRADASTVKTLNMNYGRLVDQTTVRYSIWFNGNQIKFPGELQRNTGLPFLWKVYALKDAAEPTLLAGSQSLYLTYLIDGQPIVEPLLAQSSDFASLQFLDSDDGQPGKEFNVFMSNETAGMENLELLGGGDLLLVSGHLVFDVRTGKKWAFHKNNESIENYSCPWPRSAIALSPDKTSIVFHGNFDSWNTTTENLPNSEHALVVYNFERDTAYVVKYDDTETRMTNTEEIDMTWMETYFEWKTIADGSEKLHLRKLAHPTPWLGKLRDSDHYYYLYPVKASMHSVFLDFVLAQMGWTKSNIVTDESGEYSGRRMVLGDTETKLDIVFMEDEQQISFSKHLYLPSDPNDTFYPALVKRISDAFNAELSLGKHQEHFGEIISQTKRIRSL